jgi:uncharacterized membrane protein
MSGLLTVGKRTKRRYSMATISREVQIKAPVSKVFDLVYDPNKLPEIWPNLIEIKNVKESTLGGYDYNWAYNMLGLRLEGKTRVMEFLTNRRLVTKSDRGIEDMITWNFQDDGEESHLTFEIDYEIPASLLSRHPEQLILENNGHEIDAMLRNLKTMAELELVHA